MTWHPVILPERCLCGAEMKLEEHGPWMLFICTHCRNGIMMEKR